MFISELAFLHMKPTSCQKIVHVLCFFLQVKKKQKRAIQKLTCGSICSRNLSQITAGLRLSASFPNDHELYRLKRSFPDNERMWSTCLFSAMPFVKKNKLTLLLEKFQGYYQIWHFPAHKRFTCIVRHYCYYYFKQSKHLKRSSRQLMVIAKKFQYGVFFFLNARGSSCFAKAGKKNKMLPDFRTALPLSFYIPCSIPCFSFTAATML